MVEPGIMRRLSRQPSPRATVEVATQLDDASADAFYRLYSEAFEPLRTRAVARQVLHRDEFFQEMLDQRVWKYLARDASGQPTGLTILTRHLETVPWISPEYFSARYPSHAARGAIYYLGFTLVSPSHRRSSIFEDMITAVVQRLRADEAVCAYDICAYNNEALQFAANVERLLHRHAEVTVDRLDSQTYYCADFRHVR